MPISVSCKVSFRDDDINQLQFSVVLIWLKNSLFSKVLKNMQFKKNCSPALYERAEKNGSP